MPFTIGQLIQVTWAPYPTADPTPGRDPAVYWGSPGWNGGVHAFVDGEFIEPCENWSGDRPRSGRTQWVRVVEIDGSGVYVDFAKLTAHQLASNSCPPARPKRRQIRVRCLRSREFQDELGKIYQPDPDNQNWQEGLPRPGEVWIVVVAREAAGVTYVAPAQRVVNE